MIVLVGFMGAGKSTVGALLAEELGLAFHDVDRFIESRAGLSIPELFDTYGEAHFRELEQAAIAELVRGPAAVVALGGGALEDERVRAALDGATVVYLDVSHEQALARVGDDPVRPMLRRSDLAQLHEHRRRAYRAAATLIVSSDGRTAESVVAEIIDAITAS